MPEGDRPGWVRAAVAVVVAAAVLAVPGAWLRPPGTLSQARAAEFLIRAAAAAGHPGGWVRGPLVREPFERDGRRWDTWHGVVLLPDGEIEIRFVADGSGALWVADRTSDGSPLLTDEQFAALDRFSWTPTVDAHRRTAVAATAAAFLVAVTAVILDRTGPGRHRAPGHRRDPGGAGATGGPPSPPASPVRPASPAPPVPPAVRPTSGPRRVLNPT